MVKKRLLIFLISFLVLVSLLIFNNTQETSSEVDLKDFKIDNISLGLNIEMVDLSDYKMITWKDKSYDYQFDNISIAHDSNGFITSIRGDMDKVKLSHKFENIKDVFSYFSVEYTELEYDKSQDLNMVKYVDSEIGVGLTFFYSAYDGELVWVEMYNLK